MALLCIFTACSDVDLEDAKYSEAVQNLVANCPEGSREVTLTWTNPTAAGLSGVQIIKDNTDVTNIDEVIDKYVIKKAPTNTNVSYTVKARYSDGRVSEGQTVRLYINYEVKKASDFVAMLVPNDYEQSADEKDAVAWFKKTYVDAKKGIVITPATIEDLDVEASVLLLASRIFLANWLRTTW